MKELLSKEVDNVLIHQWGIKLSANFVRCLNKQVNAFLREKVKGKMNHSASLGWPDLLTQKPVIVYDQVCYTNALLSINFCIFNIKLCWQSNSGKIYKITDEKIDET